jgi:hypothetical protein
MAQELWMQIGGIGRASASGGTFLRRPAAADVAQVPAVPAVIPDAVTPPPRSRPAPSGRPLASFLAQIIATHDGLPQTRARRRVEPAEAVACYVRADSLDTGRLVKRCV